MKILKTLVPALFVMSLAVVAAVAGPENPCKDPGIAGLFQQAITTGMESDRKALGTALYSAVLCITKTNGPLPKSHLRGPFAVVIEYLAFVRQVSIDIVSDDTIDAMARRIKPGKSRKVKNTSLEAGI